MRNVDRTRRSLLLSGAISVGATLSGCLRLAGGGATPTPTPTRTIVPGVPTAEFAFTYEENGGSGGGSLKIRHQQGDPIEAENLQIRSSENETATWNMLGSTSKSATDPVRQGDTAVIDATVVNWPSDIRSKELIRLIYISEDGSPTSLDSFNVDESSSDGDTGNSTPEGPDDDNASQGWPMFQFDVQNTGYAPQRSAPDNEFSVRWESDTGGLVAGGPVIGEGQIFVHSQAANRSVDRTLYALDVKSGDLNWKHEMDAPQENHSAGGAPAIFDGKVFNGSRDHKMYALSTKDGSQLWSHETGAGIISSPNVLNGTVYFGGRDGNAYALDANTGEEEWVTNLGNDNINGTPAIANGNVFIGNNSYLVSLDSASGEKQWQFPNNNTKLDGSVHNVTAYKGLIFFGIGPVGNTNKDNSLFAIHQDNGEIAWKALKTGTQPGVAAMDGMVFAGANKGGQYGVYTFEAESGKELWYYSAGKTNSPIALDGTVYASTRNGNVLAIDPDSGELKSRYELDDGVTRAPAVAEEAVFVGDTSGKLYSLE